MGEIIEEKKIPKIIGITRSNLAGNIIIEFILIARNFEALLFNLKRWLLQNWDYLKLWVTKLPLFIIKYKRKISFLVKKKEDNGEET